MANIEKKFNLKATKNSSFNKQQNLANKSSLFNLGKPSPLNHEYGQAHQHRPNDPDGVGGFRLGSYTPNQGVDNYGQRGFNRNVDIADGGSTTANSELDVLSGQIANYYNSGQLSGGTFQGPDFSKTKGKFGLDVNKKRFGGLDVKLNLGGNTRTISEANTFDLAGNDYNNETGDGFIQPENQYTKEQISGLIQEGGGFVSMVDGNLVAGANNTLSNNFQGSSRQDLSNLEQPYQYNRENNGFIQPNSYAYNVSPDQYVAEDFSNFKPAANTTSTRDYYQNKKTQALETKKAAQAEALEARRAAAAEKKAAAIAAKKAKREQMQAEAQAKREAVAAAKAAKIAARKK